MRARSWGTLQDQAFPLRLDPVFVQGLFPESRAHLSAK
jgi:hypothetical protein